MNYPRRGDAHFWLGRLLESQDKTQAAVCEYETAAKLDPKNKNAREALKKLGTSSRRYEAMMDIRETQSAATDALRSNKPRARLTSLGGSVGTAAGVQAVTE